MVFLWSYHPRHWTKALTCVITIFKIIFKSPYYYYFANKGPSSQSYGFYSSHVLHVRIGL